jgi:lysophospholipase L1-like esterase
MIRKVFYLLYLFVIVIAALEIILRIYNPFAFRQKGDDVILPRNRKMQFTNEKIPVIDRTTVHTKNSLGFRGPEPPKNFSEKTSIVAVGGSATECFYLDDSKYWTKLISDELTKTDTNIWINNAGFQGHSSYGHFILIDSYIKHLKPDYILFMAGINEINRYDITDNESVSRKSNRNTLWGWLKRKSEVISLLINIRRHLMADKLFVTDNYTNLRDPDLKDKSFPKTYIDSTFKVQQPLVEGYRKRLHRIIDTCLANNIKVILVTQPMLFGPGIDSLSGRNLETVGSPIGYNGRMIWQLLEQYNNVSRAAATRYSLPVIDLASEMPKSSLYFYDICHFTNEGSAKVAEIVSRHLKSILHLK